MRRQAGSWLNGGALRRLCAGCGYNGLGVIIVQIGPLLAATTNTGVRSIRSRFAPSFLPSGAPRWPGWLVLLFSVGLRGHVPEAVCPRWHSAICPLHVAPGRRVAEQ